MAKTRQHEKIVESDSSDNESASDSDSDSEPKLTQTQSIKKPQQPSFTSSESGSDSEPNPKDSPMPTQAKLAAADPVTPTTRSAAQKRSAEVKATDGKASKKPKKNEPEKKPTQTPKFQRFWSGDDELGILQGLKDYKDQKKADPASDLDAFLDFIKKSLNKKEFEKSQLRNKIKKLKKKYSDNKIKEKKVEKGGKEMTFSSPHQQSLFELSKSVWGNKNDVKESHRKAAVSNKRRRTVVAEKEDKAVDAETGSAKRVEERVLTIGDEKLGNGKKMRLEEMQALLRLLEVKTAQARLLLVNGIVL